MKRFIPIVAVVVALLVPPLVSAEDVLLTDQQITSIRLGCTSAHQGMRQVQEAEAASRVNRGRAYERTLKLLAALNSRVALSKLDAPVLTSTTARIQKKLTEFQTHYIDYAKKMDTALGIKCTEAPVSFYDSLANAREARVKVAQDIDDIDTLLTQYQEAVTQLKTDIVEAEQGVER